MTFLPIVERELRGASRRRSTYWMRIGGAIGALLIGGWMMLMMHRMPPQFLGKALFGTLSSITFIYAVIVGILLTADCLSEEKREGTLGLLFLTDLKGYDVVFGKLAANSIGSFYGMLASFPVLAISLMLGGVSYPEFWRVALVSMNILFVALAIGMFASSISRDERKSITLAFVIFLVLAAGAPIGGWIYYQDRWAQYDPTHLMLSPVYSCVMAFDPIHNTKPNQFWLSTLFMHVYGWIFLFLACRIVPRSWQDKSDSLRKQQVQKTLVEITQGKAESRKGFRTRLLETNPIYWLAARDRMKPRMVWGFLVVMAGLWILGLGKIGKDWINPATHVLTAIFLHTIFKLWIAGEACRAFVHDRRSGALELLLSTPISVRKILKGQNLALLRQFAGPVLCIVVIDLSLMAAGLNGRDISRSESPDWIIVWLAGAGVFVFDLFALAWVGMSLSLTSQNVIRASIGTIARILFLPWLAFGVTFAFFAVLAITAQFNGMFTSNINFEGYFVTIYWFALCVVNNLIWMVFAKKKLNASFREIATQRFDAPRAFWKSTELNKPPVVVSR